MERLIYEGEETVMDEEMQEFRLRYYLREDLRDLSSGRCLYGIRIVCGRKMDGQWKTEEETAEAISDSRDYVRFLLEKFRRGRVTPVSLLELVDEEGQKDEGKLPCRAQRRGGRDYREEIQVYRGREACCE